MRKYLLGAIASLLSFTATTTMAATDDPVVHGSLIFADGWAYMEDAPYGMYSFTANSSSEITLEKKGREFMANGGAVYIDGKYYTIGYQHGEYDEIADIRFRVFDVENDWKMINDVPLDYMRNIPTDLAYDPVTDKVYGCFWKDSETFTFGTLNLLTGQPETIATLSEQLVALAVNADGEFYGIGISSNLFKLDITENSVTLNKIGRTGLNVLYAQSATFDNASGRLLWSAAKHDMVESNGLYDVNLKTGAVTTLLEYPDGYEITGIYTTATMAKDAAPQAVGNLAFDANGASLSGNVTFTLPTVTVAGAPLSGEISYSVIIDESYTTVTSGKGTPGQAVSLPFTFDKAGIHTVRVSAQNQEGRSPMEALYKWIGADLAQASNAVMTSTPTGLSLTWDAPTEGINGGYINTSALTYRVERRPEGKTVYEGPATSFSEDINIINYGYYWYDVTAIADGVVGGTISSNRMILGVSRPIPYTARFNSDIDFELYTVLDVNHDHHTRQPFENSVVYEFNTENDANDWLITPPLAINPERAYKLTFKVKGSNEFLPEKLDVATGIEPTAEALTNKVASLSNINWMEFQEISAIVTTTSTEPTYIGFKACSDADRALLYVDDISVKDLGSVHAPDSVTSLTATAGANGAISATVSFRLPLKSIGGNEAAGTTKVEIYRDWIVVKTFEGGLTDGGLYTFVDDQPYTGENTYRVVTYNDFGQGIENSVKVFVGEDIPGQVENIRLEDLGNGNVKLTWDAPSKGKNGGYVNPKTLQYDVRFAEGRYGDIAKTLTETLLTEKLTLEEGKQRLVRYEITPKSPLGTGEITLSETIFLGDAYQLPYKESFAKMSLEKGPWNVISDGVARWNVVGVAEADPQDFDGGLVKFSPYITGGKSSFVSPKISLAGTTNPTLSFWLWHHNQADNNFQLVLRDASGTEHILLDINQSEIEFNGDDFLWQEYRISLDAYRESKDIQLIFKGDNHKCSYTSINYLCLDNISIRSVYDNDLAISPLSGESTVKVGERLTFSVNIENLGTTTADGYSVELWRNDKLVNKATGRAIDPDDNGYIELYDTPNYDAPQTSIYYAVIKFEADKKLDNNRTPDFAVTVLPGLPFIDTLTGSTTGTTTTLYWDSPYSTAEGVKAAATSNGEITDDFESYSPFAINNIGLWTMVDVDKSMTSGILDNYGYFVEYPNNEAEKAFMVFNPEEAGLKSMIWSAHSGKQALAAFVSYSRVNDDWAISPELDGSAQTIKFWAKAPDCSWFGTQETVQVLYSTTDKNTSSFTQIDEDIIVASEQWTEYSATLPEGAKYFAIRCTSRDQYILYIDDVTYRPAKSSLELQGYNVYRDGTLLTTTPIIETTYTDNAPEGDHIYTVTVVYNNGESRHSNAYNTASSGINDELVQDIDIRAVNGSIIVSNAEGLDVSIFSVAGTLVWNGTGDSIVSVQPGLYIVKAGDKTTKLSVK